MWRGVDDFQQLRAGTEHEGLTSDTASPECVDGDHNV
jgi:hypothetical protein